MSTLSIMYGRIGPAITALAPNLFAYQDVPSSISATGQALNAWGPFTSVSGSPLVVPDSIDGGQVIRTTTANKLLTPGGAAEFLNSGPCTMAFVWRYRSITTASIVTLLDTTDGGTKPGIQVQIGDEGNNIIYGRSITVRQWDGSSWVFDSVNIVGAIWSGAFIPFKNQTIIIRLSNTRIDVKVDGQSVKVGGWPLTRSYASGTTGKLQIGGAAADYKAIELYNSYLSDSDTSAMQARLAARFSTHPSVLIEGDPIYADPALSAGFSWISKLPNGKLYVTVTNTSELIGPQHTDHSDEFLSSDNGRTWVGPTVINTSATTLYSDLKTSEPLSDGSLIQVTMTYQVSLAFANVVWRRATTFNADGSPIWPATWNAVTVGTPTWSATQCAPIEDPTTPGTLHMAVWTLEGPSDVFWSAWDYISTNAGVTWTRHLIANGVTDSKKYAEIGLDFEGSEIRALIRDDTLASNPMLASHSTDHGVTWAAPVTVNLPAHSPGQQIRKLASGRRAVLIRRVGSSIKGGIFYQDAGASWNTAWSSSILEFEPIFGGFYYGGLYEPTPGDLVLVAARTPTGAILNVDSVYLSEWMIVTPQAMPGAVTPATAALTVSSTLQLAVTGAGDYTYDVPTNNSGGNISGSGLITVGTVNGVDTYRATDLNGHVVGTCVVTVTGASVVPAVSGIYPDLAKTGVALAFSIQGLHFSGGTVAVTINGTACTSVVASSDTLITAVTPTSLSAGGPYDVVVTVTGGPHAGSATVTGGFDIFDAHLIAHFDDAAIANTYTSNKLATAADLTGNGHTLDQLATGSQPAVTASGVNGLPGVSWVASGGGTAESAQDATMWGLSTAVSVGTVVKTTATTEQRLFGANYNNYNFMLLTASATGKFGYRTADTNVALSDVAVNDGTAHACIGAWSVATGVAKCYVDNTTPGSVTAASTTVIAARSGDHISWGATTNSDNGGAIGNSLAGLMPCALVFDIELTGALLTRVMNRLKKRAGL